MVMSMILIQILFFIFPWKIRRILLNKLFRFKIAKSAYIGYSIIMARSLIMDEQTRIGHLVICKRIDLFKMDKCSSVGNLMYITGFPTSNKSVFQAVKIRKCVLIMEECSTLTSRHFIDCNGGVYIGAFTTVAGIKSQILTHSINVYKNRQEAHPIHIGKYCFVGTGCILLPGTKLPDYSVLGAGAVLTKSFEETACLYAGSPAQKIKRLDINTTLYFQRNERMVY